MSDILYETCAECGNENEILDGEPTACTFCGSRLLPCSGCGLLTQMQCDWTLTFGCSRFPMTRPILPAKVGGWYVLQGD